MTKRKSIGIVEARKLLVELNGVCVSRAWRGHGSAIFLELGGLAVDQITGESRGEQTIMIEWSWRFEDDKSILLGSWDDEFEIDKMSDLIKDRSIEHVDFFGGLSELEIEFSGNLRFSSFTTTRGDPVWSIGFKNRDWLGVSAGDFIVEHTT